MTYNKQNLKGFTLVELAIVLVIIGLIVSSVLVGQDLIKAAELRATTRQLQEFQTGVNTFIGKYSGIPGDINGSKFGLAGLAAYQDGTAGDGDADGVIEETNAATVLTFTGEMSTFWSHLTTPGKELISGVFNGDGCDAAGANSCTASVDMPALKFGSTAWGVYSAASVNYFTTGVTMANSNVTDVVSDFIAIDAFNIDQKIDDGVPTAGDVITRGAHATVIDTAATTQAAQGSTTTHCNATTPSPDEYQYSTTTANCRLRFKMSTF